MIICVNLVHITAILTFSIMKVTYCNGYILRLKMATRWSAICKQKVNEGFSRHFSTTNAYYVTPCSCGSPCQRCTILFSKKGMIHCLPMVSPSPEVYVRLSEHCNIQICPLSFPLKPKDYHFLYSEPRNNLLFTHSRQEQLTLFHYPTE